MVAQKNMVSLAKLLRIRQGIRKKYKNIGLEKFQSLIQLSQNNLKNPLLSLLKPRKPIHSNRENFRPQESLSRKIYI
jgi:hypothetical protein